MVEMLAALIVIALASVASATFFIGSLSGSNANKARTTAAYVADEELEQITSLPPTDLAFGRSQTAVNALFATPIADRLKISAQDDTTNTSNYDTTTTHTPYIPTQTTRTVNGINFTLYNFIDICWMDVAAGVCGPDQHPANGDSTIREWRASVDAHWVSNGNCHLGCDYSTSTIIDPSSDPSYNSDLDIPVIDTFTPSTFYNFNKLVDGSANCTINSTSFPGDLVKVTFTSGLDFGATVKVSAGGGTVPTAEVTQVGSSEMDFCLETADTPGNYFITILNADGGHANEPIVEAGIVTSAVWNPSTSTESLYGSGFEPTATLSDSLHESTATGAATVTDHYPSSADVFTIPSYTPPSNGASDTFTITNPVSTTQIAYKITAPKVLSSGLTGYAGQPNNLAIAGSAFQSGMTVSLTSGDCSNPSVTYNGTGSATLNFTGGTVTTTCRFVFTNPDGGSTGSFSVTNQPVPPQVSSVSPSFAEVSTTTTLALAGTGFQSDMTASVSGGSTCVSVGSLTVSDSTTATVTLTSGSGTGTCTITLRNPSDGGTGSFTVPVSKISITGLTEGPSYLYQSTRYYPWTVTGTAFSSNAMVTLTEQVGHNTRTLTPVGVTVTNSSGTSRMTFTATPNPVGSKGHFVVTVTNPSGATASFSPTDFTPT